MQILFSKCNEAIETANKTKGFGCFYSEKNDANGNIHLHNCCEILFCMSGGKTFFIDERIYDVDDGDVFVLNQFEAHKITTDSEKQFKRFVMQIDPLFLYSASTNETDLSSCFYMRGSNVAHKIHTDAEEYEKLCRICEKLKTDYEYGDDIFKNLAALEFVATVNRLFAINNKDYTYHLKYENKTMVKAIKFINDNFSRDISLEAIAKESFVSVSELCRLFRKHMGTTVNKYIISRRMTEAKKLLKTGNSISDTSERCGFADYTSFIRSFKNVVGVTPGQYKKELKLETLKK